MSSEPITSTCSPRPASDLLPVLNALLLWGERHTTSPHPAEHMGIVHRTCGAESTSPDVCSHCGVELRPTEVVVAADPGGHRTRNRWPARAI